MSFVQTDELFQLDEFLANRWTFSIRWVLDKQMKFSNKMSFEQTDALFELVHFLNWCHSNGKSLFELHPLSFLSQKLMWVMSFKCKTTFQASHPITFGSKNSCYSNVKQLFELHFRVKKVMILNCRATFQASPPITFGSQNSCCSNAKQLFEFHTPSF